MRRAIPQLMLALVCLPLLTCAAAGAEPVALPWIEQMPNLPQPLAIKDWRATAQAYDRLVFDLGATGEYLPLVWLDDSRANFDGPGFGLPAGPRILPPRVGGQPKKPPEPAIPWK